MELPRGGLQRAASNQACALQTFQFAKNDLAQPSQSDSLETRLSSEIRRANTPGQNTKMGFPSVSKKT